MSFETESDVKGSNVKIVDDECILTSTFLAAKSSNLRIFNVWCVCECSHPSSHTCPEALIKLSELIKRSLQFGNIINI